MKHLYLIIISTFIVGFITGAYVYIQSRDVGVDLPDTEDVARGYEISADTYGGCDSFGCQSYRILENGEYTFIERKRVGDDRRYEDRISEKQTEEISRLLKKRTLDTLENSKFSGTCPIAFDGIAYTFDIRFEGERYSIDTCIEDTEGSRLIEILRDYFEIFALTHSRE